MATDGPTPPPMNQELYQKGIAVFVTNSIPSNAMERWVKKVAEQSGQRVDWHFFGGRAVVKCLGDVAKVRKAILDLMPEHEELYDKAMKGINFKRGEDYSDSQAAFMVGDTFVHWKDFRHES